MDEAVEEIPSSEPTEAGEEAQEASVSEDVQRKADTSPDGAEIGESQEEARRQSKKASNVPRLSADNVDEKRYSKTPEAPRLSEGKGEERRESKRDSNVRRASETKDEPRRGSKGSKGSNASRSSDSKAEERKESKSRSSNATQLTEAQSEERRESESQQSSEVPQSSETEEAGKPEYRASADTTSESPDLSPTESGRTSASSLDQDGTRDSSAASSMTDVESLLTPQSGGSTATGTPRGSITAGSKIPSKSFILDMSDEELVKAVATMQTKTKHLELENMVFEHFLLKNDPTVLQGFESFLENAEQIQDRLSMSRRATMSRMSRRESTLMMSSSISSQTTVAMSGLGLRGPRINITQKTDLLLKEMEEIQDKLDSARKKSHKIQFNLRSEIEEMVMREAEIKESIELFNQVFIQGEPVKNFTQTNTTEKFIRYLNEWLKKARLTVDKIRLRTSSVMVQYQKLCGIIAQKSLLGENLQEVDFEQLQIENKHLAQKIEQRNLLLLELKRMNGHANLLLSQHKKLLMGKEDDVTLLKDEIKILENKTVKIDEEAERVQNELDQAKSEYDRVKLRAETYKVPDIIDYVRKIAELGQLKKNLKVWTRRKQIKDMALNVCIRDMKNITGIRKVKSDWFRPPPDDAVSIYDREFRFQYEKKQRRWSLKNRRSGTSKKSMESIEK